MGQSVSGGGRACKELFNFSTSRSLAQETEEEKVFRLEREDEARRQAATLVELEKTRVQEERKKVEAHQSVSSQVSLELKELKKTIKQLSTDLADVDEIPEDHKKPYTKLDDYVHETMYALLKWLGSQERFKTISMGQLMFFLKSPHIKQRKRYILEVERILRTVGLSVFEKDLTTNTEELSHSFNIVPKRIAQAKKLERLETLEDLEKLQNLERRSRWHALEGIA